MTLKQRERRINKLEKLWSLSEEEERELRELREQWTKLVRIDEILGALCLQRDRELDDKLNLQYLREDVQQLLQVIDDRI